MRDYVIMTDSCCDLSAAMAEELELVVLPLSVIQDDKEYRNFLDNRELDPKIFYDRIRAGSMGSTSAANVDAFKTAMESILKEGKDILCLSFSGALSTTYQSAVIAGKELEETYGESKIIVIDTLCASLGQGMLIWLAGREKKAGKGIDEVAAYVRETIPHLCHFFTVNDLNHLKRGGRVSATTALVGTMLQIKPVLHVDDEGRLISIGKARGRKASIAALLDKIDELCIDTDTFFISHGDCQEEVEEMADQIKARFGAKEVHINYVGPVIGNHTGAGVIALFFVGKHR